MFVSWTGITEPDFYNQYRDYLMSYMNTEARKRNLELVVLSSWEVLVKEYLRRCNGLHN